MIIVSDEPMQAIRTTSAQAAIAFLGVALPDEGEYPNTFLVSTDRLLGGSQRVLLACSADDALLKA